MTIKIALAGNPNCGKTTMFNDLTGSNQYVGNWPGVTVEKKEGKLRGEKDVIIQDLPGIYSLSPYTLEEVVARSYLVNEKPDAILNIVDATNIERNLYLTTQLVELGIPMVIALNMMDLVRKNGDRIDAERLGKELGCVVLETSALKKEGSLEAAKVAAQLAREAKARKTPHVFDGNVEHTLAHIEDLITHRDGEEAVHHHHADGSKHEGGIVDDRLNRWYAIKLFERDSKVQEELDLPQGILNAIEQEIRECEADMDDDAESIIADQRYNYVGRLVGASVKKGRPHGSPTMSDKIDRIVTNRILALPIFAAVMFLVYYISVTTVGTIVTDFANDTLFGEWIQAPAVAWLENAGCTPWLVGLVGDGIIGGVGAVLGFVPQMFVLFFMLSILEDIGYMSRVAFIMDRIFRKFGLSGKSFIPLLVASGCGVPGVMASRTIESERDRRMTIMTTTFIPCGAKLPIIAMIAAAMGGAAWVGVAAYFIGIGAVVVSGIMLKKTRPFSGELSPFVMELPAYHMPAWKNVMMTVWERGWGFVKRAGTVILVSSILIWFASNYGWTKETVEVTQASGAVEMVEVADGKISFGAVENSDDSVLGKIGSVAAPVFKPLGFGDWKPTVATVMGLLAKEEVVSVFDILYETDLAAASEAEDGADAAMLAAASPVRAGFDETSGGHASLALFSFMLFNLLCAPCFAAIGAIRREMNSLKWTLFAVGYQCAFAYAVSLIVYQLGKAFAGSFGVGGAAAVAVLAVMLYMLLRKNKNDQRLNHSV